MGFDAGIFVSYDQVRFGTLEISPESPEEEPSKQESGKKKENTVMTVPIPVKAEQLITGVEVTVADSMPEDAHVLVSDDPSVSTAIEQPGILLMFDKTQFPENIRINLYYAVVILNDKPLTAHQVADAEKIKTLDSVRPPEIVNPEGDDGFTYEGGKWFIPGYAADGLVTSKDAAMNRPLYVVVALYDSSSRLIGYYIKPDSVTIP